VKFLLDENFPLPLHRKLLQEGFDAEHVTNDTQFEDAAGKCLAQIIISRLPQRLPIAQRVDICLKALGDFREKKPAQKLFDLMADGRIVPWEIKEVDQGRIFTRPG
jgi:hypothetical protein